MALNRRYRRLLVSTICLGLSFLLTLGLRLPSTAIQVSDVTNPRQAGGWVTDQANLLSNSAEQQLNALLIQLEASSEIEVAVVTVPDVAPFESPKAFTSELFNTWGIGKQGQDNGVLVMVSKGDRRVEIETGYGIEAFMPDIQVGNIISTEMIPAFKQGDYETGIVNGTLAITISLEPDLQLAGVVSDNLVQKATALVENSKQAERWRQGADERRRQRQQQAEQKLAEQQTQKTNRYRVVAGIGGGFAILGLSLFLVQVQRRFRAVTSATGVMSHAAHPIEKHLNQGVNLNITDVKIDNALAGTWIYMSLAQVGFAALSAGVMGSIVVELLAVESPLVILAMPVVVGGAIAGQAIVFRIAASAFAMFQNQLCHRLGINPWPSKLYVKHFAAFTVAIGMGVVTAFAFLFYSIFILNNTDNAAPDLHAVACVAGLSLFSSVYLVSIFQRVHRLFRERHLGGGAICQECNQALDARNLDRSELVRAATLHPEALSEAEAIAIDMGNIIYRAYGCRCCHPKQPAGMVSLQRVPRKVAIKCPQCGEDTLESETTQHRSGDYIHYSRVEFCHFCDYDNSNEWEKYDPKPVERSSTSSSSFSSSSSSSSSPQTTSNSSSSFGGGSSGGGGAGGSW